MTGRILIADDIPTNRIVLRTKLASACYTVRVAETGREALQIAAEWAPDLVLVNVELPDMSGVALCRDLKAGARTAATSLLVLTPIVDRKAKFAALKAGADDVLCHPIDRITLLARVRSLLRARATAEELRLRESTALAFGFAEAPSRFEPKGRVTLVSTKGAEATALSLALGAMVSGRFRVATPQQVLGAEGGHRADVYLLMTDATGATEDGLSLLAELRARTDSRYASVLVQYEPKDRDSLVMALDFGANDVVSAGAEPEELAIRLRKELRRKAEADRLRNSMSDGLQMAITDPLTGLYNRRYAEPYVEKLARQSKPRAERFALMILDIDRFKAVNDTHGHAVGDEVLVEVAHRIKANLRDGDLVARVGGEEFLVALPIGDEATALRTAERLCRLIKAKPMICARDVRLTVTVSVGVAMSGEGETVAAHLARADRALYHAKNTGRDQVTMSQVAA